jgi:hypothetical protein
MILLHATNARGLPFAVLLPGLVLVFGITCVLGF